MALMGLGLMGPGPGLGLGLGRGLGLKACESASIWGEIMQKMKKPAFMQAFSGFPSNYQEKS
ncbi:hypothetical protein [Paenibacillus alba]|uniref:Uncharacterized protein n=1 Tax=Paenibacillus alba TaxID=1197127 RepID=A0ABU6G4K3_9BACL|nr:hypothetical protein [Paenibacillus alba]MEC0227788.1 hypothetical protein [Paenibacillus alba]